jgi:hypothetical protein
MVRVSPPISSVPPQEGLFDVYVVLEDLQHHGVITYENPARQEDSDGMAAFEFTFRFDPAVLTVESVERGPDLDRTGRVFQCLPPQSDEPGKFRYGCVSTGQSDVDGVQGTLTLATVTLRAISRGSSPLLVEAGLAGPLGDAIPIETAGAVVRALGRPGVAKDTPGPTNARTQPAGTANATAQPSALVTSTAGAATAITQTAQAARTTTPGATPAPTTDNDPETPNNNDDGDGWQPGAGFWAAIIAGGALAATGAVLSVGLLRRRRGGA